MKKIMSALLVFGMLLSLAVPAFADETTSEIKAVVEPNNAATHDVYVKYGLEQKEFDSDARKDADKDAVYKVVVTWNDFADAKYQIATKYVWSADEAKYVLVEKENAEPVTGSAVLKVTLANKSNRDVYASYSYTSEKKTVNEAEVDISEFEEVSVNNGSGQSVMSVANGTLHGLNEYVDLSQNLTSGWEANTTTNDVFTFKLNDNGMKYFADVLKEQPDGRTKMGTVKVEITLPDTQCTNQAYWQN